MCLAVERSEMQCKLAESRRECTGTVLCSAFWLVGDLASQAAEAAEGVRKMNQPLNFETVRRSEKLGLSSSLSEHIKH